jgi:hypothetical protein
MPMIIYGAVMDLRGKGMSISLLGDAEATDIKVFMRTVEYDEFLSRFYDEVPLSPRGMCLAAAAKRTQEDLIRSPRAVLELGLAEDDLAAVFKQHYDRLRLSDPGLLIVARADKKQDDLIGMDPSSVMDLGMSDEDSVALLRMYHYDQLPLSDKGLLTAAKAGQSQHEVLAYDEVALAALGLGAEDIGAVAEAVAADQRGFRV